MRELPLSAGSSPEVAQLEAEEFGLFNVWTDWVVRVAAKPGAGERTVDGILTAACPILSFEI